MKYPLKKIVVTQKFGDRPEYYSQFGLKGHEGVDFKTKNLGISSFWNELMGYQEVIAVKDGLCTAYYGHPYYGTYIVLEDNDGNEFYYCHLKNARPPSPKQVIPGKILMFTAKEGETVGITGSSGNVTAPHLHFMYKPKDANLDNGYKGFENPMSLFKQSLKIARIGVNLPQFDELQVEVAKYTKNMLSLASVDYSVPEGSAGMIDQATAYEIVGSIKPEETFVQIYYKSPSAPFLTSYSNGKGKFISTLPNNPPTNLIAYELSHCLQFYCNDILKAGIQIEDSNFPDESFIQRKFDSVDKYLPLIF